MKVCVISALKIENFNSKYWTVSTRQNSTR